MNKNENGLYIMDDGETVIVSNDHCHVWIINEPTETRIVVRGMYREVDHGSYKNVLPAVDLRVEDPSKGDKVDRIVRVTVIPTAGK